MLQLGSSTIERASKCVCRCDRKAVSLLSVPSTKRTTFTMVRYAAPGGAGGGGEGSGEGGGDDGGGGEGGGEGGGGDGGGGQ